MKSKIGNSSVALFILCGLSLNLVHAQTFTPPNADVSGLSDYEVELKAIEMTTPEPASNAPTAASFYSAQNPGWPPFPANIHHDQIWDVGGGFVLLNDVDYDYSTPQASSMSSRSGFEAMDDSEPPIPEGGSGTNGGGGGSSFQLPALDFGSNIWIRFDGISNGNLVGIISNSEADVRYEIESRQSLSGTDEWVSTGQFLSGSELTNWTALNLSIVSLTNNLFFRIRSWIDSDNIGIPDWWQLQFFNAIGIDPYALSPSGDGYTIWQKYNGGLNPTNFETPPAPGNFVALLSTNGTNVLLSWDTAQGSVTNYVVERGEFNFETYEYDYSQIGEVDADTTSFMDVGAVNNEDELYDDTYVLEAVYPGGNTSQTTSSYIDQTAPVPPPPPAPVFDIYVSATLVRNATGRWQLMFSGLPSSAQTINLIWTDSNGNSTTQNVSASILTNGIYQVPDTDAVSYLGDSISVQGIGANGEPGQVVPTGVLPNDAPYFVDGRQHMKQNLEFLIRGASLYRPMMGMPYDYYSPYVSRYNLASISFEEFSFLYHNTALDNLWPFTANYDLANYLVDTSRTNMDQYPMGTTNFNFTPDFATHIPAPPILAHSDPYWILQPCFDWFGDNTANWGVTITNNYTVASLQSGLDNLFGLPYETGCEIDAYMFIDPSVGLPIYDSIYQPLAPGDSVSVEYPQEGYTTGEYASQCPAPTLQLVNYYFAPLNNPNGNTMSLPPVNQQPVPLPIDDSFNVTNQTPPLIIAAVGQPMIIGGWAKYAIEESSPAKYAYLGQYFMTNCFLLGEGGNVTTNSAGILSPYGEFFPTQAGTAQLITMPDIDTGLQSTCTVQVISLNVDANHDGMMDLSYLGQDQTSQGKPYVFWCNNNFDRWNNDFPFDTPEQDDVQGGNTTDGNYLDDFDNRIIPDTRDLEDFSRLWINGVTTNLLAALPYGSSITLSWGDVGSPNSGNPTIDLFQTADVDGGVGYLTNETIAIEQTNTIKCPYVGRLGPGDSIQLNSLENNLATTHFIWCGVTNGSGKLTLTFTDPNGNILGQASVYIQIKDIKQMYERWTVGDNTTQPPATTAYLAGDLPSDMAQSFQYTTLAATNTPYILFVHGWNMPYWDKDRYAETAFKRLYWQGYQGRFGEFRWPTYTGYTTYDSSELQAWKSGTGLLNKLNDLNTQYPSQVYLMAHSMGNVVAGEALKQAGASQVVNTYVAMQGAVPAQAYDATATTRSLGDDELDMPNCYADYWTNGAPCYFNGSAGAGTYVNFFNTNDYALNKWTTDQNQKPDVLSGYYFDDPDLYYKDSEELFFPTNTYELFARVIQARSYALGAQQDVGGVFKTLTYHEVNLPSVWPPDPSGKNYTYHIWHSIEFRSDSPQLWQFWDQVLFQMGIKKNL